MIITTFAGCVLPAVDCHRVTWPDVTSSIRRPVSADVIRHDDVSATWRRPAGTQDNTRSPGRVWGPRGGSTSLPPCSGHVTPQLFPVCGEKEDATTRSSGMTSLRADRRHHVMTSSSADRIVSSSRSRSSGDDAIDREEEEEAPFPRRRLGHVTGSELAAWSLRAFAAALLQRQRFMDVPARPDAPDSAPRGDV